MKRIIVTGCGGSAAANFIDSLRISGEKFHIVGTDTNKYHIELSRADAKYRLPLASDPSYLDKLNGLIEREGIDLVHPQPDPEVLFLSRNREKVNAKLFLPSKEAIEICQDKMRFIDTVKRAGVATGKTYLINSSDDLDAAMGELLKTNEKAWLRAIRGAGSRASLPIKHSEHGRVWIDYWSKMKGVGYGEFMLTEFLPGKEFAFQSIWKDGELMTSQARERIEYIFGNLTPSGQTSSPSVAKTVHRKDVNDTATEAILAVDKNATGIFCVDMKENLKGVPCVTEINCGRFFTTSNFFSHAGVNMPHLYVKLAFGEDIPEMKKYDPLPADWFWIRMIDMGYKLVKNEWTSKSL